MARKLDDVMAALPKERQRRVEARAMELATLKDLRLAALQTQEQMAAALGVESGQRRKAAGTRRGARAAA